PDWAFGLPIAAKVWTRPRYAKSTVAPGKPVAVPTECVDAATKPKKAKTAKPKTKTESATPNKTATSPPIEPDADDVSADLELTKALAIVPLADLVSEPMTNSQVCCPFHQDNTPSCRIYDDHFYCFGCGARGSQIDWLTKVEGLDRDEAIARLKAWDG